MRVLVTGGRLYDKRATLFRVLDRLHDRTPVSLLVVGDATGADELACHWAQERGVPIAVHRAEWEEYGKAAGPIRNRQMLHERNPDLVIAFSGGRGTQDCVRQAVAKGVNVVRIGWK